MQFSPGQLILGNARVASNFRRGDTRSSSSAHHKHYCSL